MEAEEVHVTDLPEGDQWVNMDDDDDDDEEGGAHPGVECRSQ